MNDFGKWLGEEIERRGWTQREFARRTQVVTQPTIGRIIAGQTSPTLDTLQGIARALGLSLEEVLRKAGILPAVGELPEGWIELGQRLTALSAQTRALAIQAMDRVLVVFENAASPVRRR